MLAAGLLSVVAACSPAAGGDSAEGLDPIVRGSAASAAALSASPSSTTTTTTVRPNSAPWMEGDLVVASPPGATATADLVLIDAEDDPITVTVEGPPDLTVDPGRDGRWTVTWSPTSTGTDEVVLRLADDRGAVRTEMFTVRATNPGRDGLVGLGDSVASGHGLQKRDYVGRDRCWRSEREAYPWLVREALVGQGRLADDSLFALVACSGATVEDLLGDSVGGGPDDGLGDRSQVDWAVDLNPTLITLTIGANTLGFTDPWRLVGADGVDHSALAPRLDDVRTGLDTVLDRLVAHTDSRIVVTGYYDPTAADPQGVDGCRGDCFATRTAEVVDVFNDVLAGAVGRQPRDRVDFVDLAAPFAGHGAPNGLGPDGFRAGSAGWLRDLVGAPVEGVHPYCARGHDDAGSWINYVDCVHPDGRGHTEIAAAVLDALD